LAAVARPKKSGLSADLGEAIAQQETPTFKWGAVAKIGGAFAILWVTAFMLVPYVGYWVVGIVAVLTAVAIGFGIYVYRLTSKSRAVVDIMKQATDDEGRARALAELEAAGDSDAMKTLARAQLLSQTDPGAALKVLEEIDVDKAPAVLQDDLRAQTAMLYLRNNRTREARDLADKVRLDRRPDPKTKALYAAIMAEAYARTGSEGEARKLLETYDPARSDSNEIRAMLLRAQVYTYIAQKKRGRASEAMQALSSIEPNLVAAFLQKGNPPELIKLARQVLGGAAQPKMQRRMR
jgi:hypothetical protein